MHIKDSFILKKVADEYFAVPFDKAYETMGGMITLNKTGAFLWELLKNETDTDSLEMALIKEYGIDFEIAKVAVSEFINSLREHSLIVE